MLLYACILTSTPAPTRRLLIMVFSVFTSLLRSNNYHSMETNLLVFLTLLSVTITEVSQVTLTWQDNSNNESGFIIERGNGVQGPTGLFIPIGSVGENVTTYIDQNVVPTAQYSYRVFA